MTTAGPETLLSLAGRRALVTGGGGGIGGAVVRLLLAAGARVVSLDLPQRPPPAGAEHLACDLRDSVAIRAALDRLATGRACDAFVHCAGITRDAVLWKLSGADWEDVLRVNLESAFHLLAGLVPGMRELGRGHVVLVASINGERGKFGQTNYAASKAGLIGFAKSAARELGRFGIRVNVVSPGWIDTTMTEGVPAAAREAALAETALGRFGRPDDVARAVLYLCSELSSHVTGQVLRVDGGQCTA